MAINHQYLTLEEKRDDLEDRYNASLRLFYDQKGAFQEAVGAFLSEFSRYSLEDLESASQALYECKKNTLELDFLLFEAEKSLAVMEGSK